MSKQAIITKEDISGDTEDTKKIIQITFFDEINEEDIRKTKWLLDKYTDKIAYKIGVKCCSNYLSSFPIESASICDEISSPLGEKA